MKKQAQTYYLISLLSILAPPEHIIDKGEYGRVTP